MPESLQVVCPNCGQPVTATARFCSACGNRIETSVEPIAKAERRQLTVMFCDLVGSTALAERLDPEDLHGLITAYQSACNRVIQRYQGHIAQYLGDQLRRELAPR